MPEPEKEMFQVWHEPLHLLPLAEYPDGGLHLSSTPKVWGREIVVRQSGQSHRGRMKHLRRASSSRANATALFAKFDRPREEMNR